ncbi:response regulator [Lentibacillus sp. N15]|uniref:response regulator n=1 Tax=Lentibacillus songyuanensis TaxID=3136161 RepID=UPI0031BA19F0
MEKEILVVDDQPGIRLLLGEVFANEGYHVVTAETGKEALDKLHQKTFDLIVLDYKLPIIDGAEVLRRLKQDEIMTPAIIMSGLAEELANVPRDCPNVKKIVAKPFNINDICAITRELLNCNN